MPYVITSLAGLRAIYSEDGAALVQAKLAQWASTVPSVTVQVLATRTPSPSIAPDATSLYAEMKAAVAAGRANQNRLDEGIIIVGDQRIFPGFTVMNPVPDRRVDPDATVLTDNPYGQFNWSAPEQCVLPPIAVGRLAAGVDQSAAGLCALIDSTIALQRQSARRTGYVEITSRQWQDSSSSVLSTVTPSARVIVSPDGRVSAANASLLDCKFLYCNLHGFLNESAWSGYDNGLSRAVPAVTPDAFARQFVSGTVAFTEACYGLATSGKRTSASNALSLLAAGAAAVVGSTGLAFGTADVKPQDLIDADVLARNFFNMALTSGSTVGQSLLAARQVLRTTAPLSDAYLTKTLLEFQILGDPSYALG